MEIIKRLISVGDNELCKKIADIKDGETIVLEKKVYDVWQDDCFHSDGYFFSNTAETELNPNGERFSAIFIKDKKNVTIDGNGATIMIHGVMTPFLIDNSKNVTIKNLTIDYFRPTMSEFLIEKNDGNGNCILKINKESLYEIKDNFLYWYGETGKDGKRFFEYPYKSWEMISMYYNPETEETKFLNRDDDDYRPSVPHITSFEDLGENRVKVTLKNKDIIFPEGCTVQSRTFRRSQTGGYCGNSKNVTLDGLTVYAMHGFGMLFQYCNGATLKNLRNVRKEGRTIASNADFYHFSGCKGTIKVIGCHAETAHDDFINVHGTHLRIIDVDQKQKTVKLKYMNTQTWGFQAYYVGDKVDFINGNTLVPYGSAKVKSVEKLSDYEVLLTLSKLPKNIELNKDALENATYTPKLIAKNNYFGPSMGRGILCTTRKKVVIEKNVFYKTGGKPLSVEDDCNFWYESGYCKKIIFRKNQVISSPCGSWYTVPPVIFVHPMVMDKTFDGTVHGKVVIEKNSFVKPAQGSNYLLDFSYTDKAVVRKNVFDTEYEIKTKRVKKLVDKKNTVLDKKENK